jgi:hypothetical protein
MATPMPVLSKVSVGVKEGDWIEYTINMSGPPLDPLRNLTWFRTEILQVDGEWLQVNKTALSIDGTYSSSTWNFNLTQGQTYGWVIIPSNLSEGDRFFDAEKSANITIEGEELKTLLGATRIVIHATEPGKVYKEWDKTTGVYVYSIEYTDDFAVTFNATATNMWNPQTHVQTWTVLYLLIVAISISAIIILSIKKRIQIKRAKLQ